MKITVAWQDGRRKAYNCEDYRVTEGILWLMPQDRSEASTGLPIPSIREITVERH